MYDIDLTATDCNNQNVKTILNVAEFAYTFREKNETQRRQVWIIGNSESDCLQTIQQSLKPGTKFQVNEMQSIFCTVGVLTDTIKKLLYEELKAEFSEQENQQTSITDKIKQLARSK